MEKRETLDAIWERIKALEGEVCALQVQNKRLRVIIAALVFLAVLPYLLAAGMQTQTFSVLRVERIEFVQDGEVMAAIVGGKTVGPGSGLIICDKDNKPMVQISSFSGGPFAGSRGIVLLDREGKRAITLTAAPVGINAVNVFNNEGKIVAFLGTTGELSHPFDRNSGLLYISDGTGKPMINLAVLPDTGGDIRIWRSSRVSNAEKPAVVISVAKNGSGTITTTDFLGLPIWISPLR